MEITESLDNMWTKTIKNKIKEQWVTAGLKPLPA